MDMKIINTEKAPAPVGPYSQAIECNGFLFCSGQIAIDPDTNEVIQGDVTEQAQLVMKNIGAVLDASGLNYSDVVKTTIFLSDMGTFAQVNEVYAKYFGETKPARSCVEASALPKGVDVEIEVLAKLQ